MEVSEFGLGKKPRLHVFLCFYHADFSGLHRCVRFRAVVVLQSRAVVVLPVTMVNRFQHGLNFNQLSLVVLFRTLMNWNTVL